MIYTCLSQVPYTQKGVYFHPGTSKLYLLSGAVLDQEYVDPYHLPSNVEIIFRDTSYTEIHVRYGSIYWNTLQLIGKSDKLRDFHEDFPEYLI